MTCPLSLSVADKRGKAGSSAHDPMIRGSGLQEAQKDGLTLLYDNFILFSATINGEKAQRNVMIRCLNDCQLRELSQQDYVSQACERA